MKPRAKGGVVDSELNVYGTQNLKVAGTSEASDRSTSDSEGDSHASTPDLSISPSNVGANTAATAGLIGEKAAIIIARELGIQGV